MVKFLDKNRKDEYYDNELLVRCATGWGILSFRTSKLEIEGENMAVLEIIHYGVTSNIKVDGRLNNKANKQLFADPQTIKILYKVLVGEINDGVGYIETALSFIMGVNTDEHGNVALYLVKNPKCVYKLLKDPMKHAEKTILWGVEIEKNEVQKVASFLKSFIDKNFKDEANTEEEQKQ